MPTNDPEYMRNYQKARRAGHSEPEEASVAKTSPVKRTEEVPQTESRYGCGCEPGLPCIGHGIQKMQQSEIDRILRSPEINRPGRRG